MASLCSVTGTFTDAQGNGINGATLHFNIESPVVDTNGNLLVPQEFTTTTAADGAWTLSIEQGVSGLLTLDLNQSSTSPISKYKFSLVVPSLSSATFASCWADSASFVSQSTSQAITFASIAGQLAAAQLPVLSSDKFWLGNGSNVATAVTMAGDVTMTNAGVTAIGSGKLTDAMVNSTSTIYTRLHDTVSVKDYGAKGDGSTDDTTAIQNAITAVAALNSTAGGTLYFPPGVYKCTSTINLAHKCSLLGSGIFGSELHFTNTGDGLALLDPVNSSTAAYINIQNLTVYNTNNSNTGCGIRNTGGSFFYIDLCYVQGFKYGVVFDQAEVCSLTNSIVQLQLLANIWLTNGADLSLGASQGYTNSILIQCNQLNIATSGTFNVIDDGGANHTFIGNNFEGAASNLRVAGAAPFTFINNEIEGASSTPVLIKNTSQSSSTVVGPVAGATFKDNSVTGENDSSYAILIDELYNSEISFNGFAQVNTAVFGFSTTKVSGCTFSGNSKLLFSAFRLGTPFFDTTLTSAMKGNNVIQQACETYVSASSSAGSVTITPSTMEGIAIGDTLFCQNLDYTNSEYATVTATTGSTFTLTLASSKAINWVIKGVPKVTGPQQATGNSYVGGRLSVGVAPAANISAYVSGSGTSGSSQKGVSVTPTLSSTDDSRGLYLAPTIAASTALTNYYGAVIDNVSLGSGASASVQEGVHINDLTSATTNYGLRSQVSTGSNKYNLYVDGTAPSYFNANVSTTTGFIPGYTTTATAAATTTLSVSSPQQQYFTGSTTQGVVLPVTSTLTLGQYFEVINNSSGIVTVKSSGANTIQAMAANTRLVVTCILTSGTTAASWNAEYSESAAGVTSLTGDVTGTGPGATAATVAAIQGTTVSGTTGSGNVVFSASPTMSGTATIPTVASAASLVLKTNGSTTALTLDTSQNAQFAGSIGTGGAPNASYGVNIVNTALTGTSQYGLVANHTGSSAATVNITGVAGAPASAATTFTVASVQSFRAFNPAKGATSTITTAYGLLIDAITAGATNYAIKTGSGMTVLAGNTRLGGGSDPTVACDVTGAANISGTVNLASLSASQAVFTDSSKNLISKAVTAPTVQIFTSGASQTYTTPTSPSPLYVVVEMIGGGGAGGGGGTSGGSAGTAGNNTVFGAATAGGGGGGGPGSGTVTGGAGGTNTTSYTILDNFAGAAGSGGGSYETIATINGELTGPTGPGTPYAGGGGSTYTGTGLTPVANSGAGGAGGSAASGGTNSQTGGAGGAGGFMRLQITSPSATYTYTVGGTAASGSAGTNGYAGGPGAAGRIKVTEFYQ